MWRVHRALPAISGRISGATILLAWLSCSPGLAAEAGRQLILGTCVQGDMTSPAVGLQVTFIPDSTSTTTDSEGDFILDWSGRAGFLQIEGPHTCRRIAISAAESEDDLDVGLVRAPRGIASRTAGLRPGSAPPDTLAGAPPASEVNRFWFMVHATFDLFGNLTEFGKQSGDADVPEHLVAAVAAWADTAAWVVRRDARCEDPPFEASLPIAYYWSPSAGAWIRDPDNRPR